MIGAKRQLIFESGERFLGDGFGGAADVAAEVIFNTAMAGYQEILSDPAYSGQMVLMTYPLIGNYGLADDDYEGRIPRLSGLIVREYNDHPTNYRYTRTLDDVMQEHGIAGLAGVDTRKMARMIREKGALRALMTDAGCSLEEGLGRLAAAPPDGGQVERVSCKKLWYARTAGFRYHVVAVDLGIKTSMIRRLSEMGCNVTIVPFDMRPEEILSLRPDGLLLAGGPGDPREVPGARERVRALAGKLPILGVGLGHQLLALAHGMTVSRMRAGHHGANHAVKALSGGRVSITSQSHLYVVDKASVGGSPFRLAYENLGDGTVEGLQSDALDILSVQFHPEGGPGAQDEDGALGWFEARMEENRKGRSAFNA